jgi:hypothetical protein
LIATEGRLFFSHRRRMLLSRLCLLLPTPLALSPQKATPVPTTTLTLSLSSEGHSLDLCAQMSLPPAVCALMIALNFSPQKVGAAAGRPAACATAKGARANVDGTVLRAITAAATPPPILLLGCARLVESPHQGEN